MKLSDLEQQSSSVIATKSLAGRRVAENYLVSYRSAETSKAPELKSAKAEISNSDQKQSYINRHLKEAEEQFSRLVKNDQNFTKLTRST